MSYFNHRLHIAHSAWGRWEFLGSWRRLYAGDGRWTPPHFPTLRRELRADKGGHLARLDFGLLYVDAIRRRQRRGLERLSEPPTPMVIAMEVALAAAVAAIDPRRRDRTAHLALLHLANDADTLRFFLDGLVEKLRSAGQNRLIGPVGLSPHLGSGVLQDQWSQWPPLHTPYNPPYLPELLADVMRPVETRRLFHLPIAAAAQRDAGDAPAQLVPLDPRRLAGDLLPLLAAACENRLGFPVPDAEEAAFLLRWLYVRTLDGWLARVDGTPVGFVLLQPDLAARLRRLGGARRWWARLAWPVAQRVAVANGRLLFGAVLPDYRRQGIGRQLLQQAIGTAQARGWQTVTVGPLRADATAVSLLTQFDAVPQQSYAIYDYQF